LMGNILRRLLLIHFIRFNRYIDQLLVTMRAKNAIEILNDATLVCYHSFDGGSYIDSGPMGLNGTAINITSVSGRINQAISLTSNSSYYQVRILSFHSLNIFWNDFV
jgi:hypothetical protein